MVDGCLGQRRQVQLPDSRPWGLQARRLQVLAQVRVLDRRPAEREEEDERPGARRLPHGGRGGRKAVVHIRQAGGPAARHDARAWGVQACLPGPLGHRVYAEGVVRGVLEERHGVVEDPGAWRLRPRVVQEWLRELCQVLHVWQVWRACGRQDSRAHCATHAVQVREDVACLLARLLACVRSCSPLSDAFSMILLWMRWWVK
mmetsp:Transcript_48706/g.122936  ORF Transcript_48706/g.122936 Transcript_48706/m.122936 type:complete len:202 (+) Transcript_48706:261-866(+)